jgi:hypothetical protein
VTAEKGGTGLFSEERYTHAGSTMIIRGYRAGGSLLIMLDCGETEPIGNAQNPHAAGPVSVVRLP